MTVMFHVIIINKKVIITLFIYISTFKNRCLKSALTEITKAEKGRTLGTIKLNRSNRDQKTKRIKQRVMLLKATKENKLVSWK